MAFWLIVAIVVSLSIGFVMGATFRQYKKPFKPIFVKNPYEVQIQIPRTIHYGSASEPKDWTILYGDKWVKKQ